MQLDSRTHGKSKPISGKELKPYLSCMYMSFRLDYFCNAKTDIFKSKAYRKLHERQTLHSLPSDNPIRKSQNAIHAHLIK